MMNDAFFLYIYSACCVLLYTQSALQSCGGSLLNHHQCAASTWMIHRTTAPVRSPHNSYRWRGQKDGANQVYALTTHQLQVERRVIEPIKWMGIIRRPVVGIWPGHRGYTLLFTKRAMGFLMTTESQDLGLTSHPKDGNR